MKALGTRRGLGFRTHAADQPWNFHVSVKVEARRGFYRNIHRRRCGEVPGNIRIGELVRRHFIHPKTPQPETFPAHKRDELVNVDDLTTIADQVFFVSGMGLEAKIGGFLPNTGARVSVCDLGQRGWSQAYVGLGALSWSDPILDDVDATKSPYATFFLKTDTGDFLMTIARRKKNVGALTGSADFDCFTFKDPDMQQVEYKRTLGFERTQNAKPYYIY